MARMTVTVLRGRPPPRAEVARLAAGRLPALLTLAALTAWAVHARTRDLGVPLWIDEGISFGVAHHSLLAIPGVLRQDGAPPLFYVVLHLWTGVFSATPRSGHALSLLFAVLAVPAAYWAAEVPFGRHAGLLAAAIVALDPFAGTYAIEIRMYSMLLLLGLLATGTFLRAFVAYPGHRGWAAAFAVALAAVMYTHNWGLFFAAATGLAWLALVATTARPLRRPLAIAGLIGFGGAVLLFAPWVPTVLDQARHTGAPWSHAPHRRSIGRAFERLLGGNLAETVLLLLALAGAVAGGLLRPPSATAARAALATAGLALLTFAIAYAWSNVSSPAWALRYLCIVLAPAAIVIGAGLSRLGPVAWVALAVVFVGSWHGTPSHSSLARKSNVAVVAHRLGPALPPGTQVFSTQPEQVPVLRYYLPGGLRYVTPLGPVPDPRVMNWRDAMTRLDRPSAATTFAGVLDRLRPGARVLLVQPRFSAPSARWTLRIRQLARRAHRARLARPEIRLVRSVVPRRGSSRSTVAGLLLQRRRGASG
jgi:mannosyltransferase